MDFHTMKLGKSNKDVNILVMMVHFTGYAQAYITSSQTVTTVTKMLWNNFLVLYRFPKKILMDQGRNSDSRLVATHCQLAQVKKLLTTPYRPQSNGQCNSFNSTLINMIRRLLPKAKVQ